MLFSYASGSRLSSPAEQCAKGTEKPACSAFPPAGFTCLRGLPGSPARGEIPAMTQPRSDPLPSAPPLQVPTFDFMRVEWRFLLFGVAMAFCSSLGQTFFISLFSSEIRSELGLSHGAFGTYSVSYTHLTLPTTPYV